MTSSFSFARVMKFRLAFSALVLAACWDHPLAAQTVDLGSVTVGGGAADEGDVGSAAPPGSAAAVAPAQGSLEATQPQSIVSNKILRDMIAPSSDYNQAIQWTPSVFFSTPNGPGGSETTPKIRGFVDGQYNITIDGIPFADTNDFTHHSTTFFPPGTLSKVIVDRGPGQASTMGNATFGGTLALFSRELADQPGGLVSMGYGSFNAFHNTTEVQSGLIKETATRFLVSVDANNTDGALQNAKAGQLNTLFKLEQPVGQDFLVTLFSSVDHSTYNNAAMITLAQEQQYGKTYAGLNRNPVSAQFVPYNHSDKSSDFEYIAVTGDLGRIHLDNKAYTYGYINDNHSVSDQTTDTTASLYTANQLRANPALANDVMGFVQDMRMRAYGDIFTVARDVDLGAASGTARTGLWAEQQNDPRYRLQRDDTLGVVVPTATYPTGHTFNILSKAYTFEPFVEYEWRPWAPLSITPGYKHVEFSRDQFGNPNQAGSGNAGQAVAASASYRADLPFLTARARLTPELSAYGQYAQGFLAPNVNAFYVPDPNADKLAPQTTTNYQTGVVWKSSRLTVDADAYLIDFANMASLVPAAGTTPAYYTNVGGVIYKGLEAEGTVVVGSGLSLYAGGSLNQAKTKGSHLWIANAPDYTLAGGVIYDYDQIFASLLNKVVGHRYATQQVAATQANRLAPYNTTDLMVGYRFGDVLPRTTGLKVEFGITNLFDHHSITDSNGALNAQGTGIDPLKTTYYWMPGRSYFGSLTAAF